MPVALNSLLCHISQKTLRVIFHLHLKHMEDRIRIFRMMLQGNRRICNFLCVPPSNLPPAGSPFRQIFQADTQHCSLDALQSIIISNLIMIITHIAALIFQAVIQGERLDILISSIEYAGNIIPVQLATYDIDGQKGIFVPGSETRNAAKDAAGTVSESMGNSVSFARSAGQQVVMHQLFGLASIAGGQGVATLLEAV